MSGGGAGGGVRMRRARAPLLAALLALATAAAYLPVAGNGFVFDDEQYVTDNPALRQGLGPRGVAWAFTTFHASNWHPLAWVSHLLDVTLFGLEPAGHHLVNLALHVASAVLVLLVLEAMTGALGRSAFVAGAFALHPLHVESVAWVAERKDVLAGLLWTLTMAAYLGYARRPGRGRFALALVLFALGLLAKPMLVSLPFALLLLDVWPLGRIGRRGEGLRALLVEKAPFLLLSGLSAAVTVAAQARGGAIEPLASGSLAARVGNALLAYVAYLRKTFWPSGLAVHYPDPGAAVNLTNALAAAALLGAASWGAFALGRRRGYPAAGWLWYLGTLVPVIGIVKVGGQAMADRYTYLPLVGIFVAVAWGAAELAGSPRRRLALGAAAAVSLAAAGFLAHRQTGVWRDDLTLFGHALAVTRDNAFAENALANRLAAAGRTDEAIRHLENALRIAPRFPEANNELGSALTKKGLLREGEARFRAALAKPRFVRARVNLADNLMRQGRLPEARAWYDEALRLHPGDVGARVGLGALLHDQGRTEEAQALFEGVLRDDPSSAAAHYNLALLLSRRGRNGEALPHLEEAVRIGPDRAETWNNLGCVLMLLGRRGEAADAWRRALRVDPAHASARENLGRLAPPAR